MSKYNAKQSSNGDFKWTNGVDVVGGVGTAPASGSYEIVEHQFGPFIRTDITFRACRVSVTDGAASGSYGTLQVYAFPQSAVTFLGSRQNYTAFAEGAALTGAAGDAAFEIGFGTTAISAAADGTLGNGAQENVGQAVSVTLSGGTGTGTAVDGCKTTALNGTASALGLHLNWSGTAATIDANSTIDVTGTLSFLWCHMGDD